MLLIPKRVGKIFNWAMLQVGLVGFLATVLQKQKNNNKTISCNNGSFNTYLLIVGHHFSMLSFQ